MIDLHCHTVYSDGADTPAQVLALAQELGLTALSITDHNTVRAYRDPAMERWQDLYQGTLIPGVEVTCTFEGQVVEVLGYGFDLLQMERELAAHVLTFEQKQRAEEELIRARFVQLGIEVPDELAYDPTHESSRKAFLRILHEHPEKRALLSDPASWETSRTFTRHEIYNPESAFYVDESCLYPTLAEAVALIHAAGGVALLAHLYEYAAAPSMRPRLAEIVADAQLDGVECAHSIFTADQIADLEQFDAQHGLLKSGGSDYHGARKPGIALGSGKSNLAVPEAYLDSWSARASSR